MGEAQNLQWGRRLAWLACGTFILLLLPILKYAEPWWTLQRPQKLALVVVLGAFAVAGLLSIVFDRSASWPTARWSLVRSFAVLSVFVSAAAVLSITLPRYLLIPLIVLLALTIPLSVSPMARARWPLGALLGFAGLMTAYSVGHVAVSPEIELTARDVYFSTAFYPLHATIREGWLPQPATRGGGMDLLGDRVLLGTGDGHLYVVDVPEDRSRFKVQELATRVPANREEFAAAFGGSTHSPTRSKDWHESGPPKVQTWRFRVADVITAVDGDRVRIFASHHYWNAQESCFVVRISALTASLGNLSQSVAQAPWTTLYETTPCVPLTGPQRKRGKNPFRGEEIGGRMQLLAGDQLLITIGDQAFSGIESVQAFSQDPAVDYGKTLLIDLVTHERRIFTSGHRNPQGLHQARDGRLWLTEHGAQGGDELNLLQPDANFGWPAVTYGTDYGSTVWPLNQTQGRHPNYRQPILAWVPSIGVSAIAELGDRLFPIWQGDLLVGSLATRSLYRLVVVEDRIVVQEPIKLDKRVRDILQLPDGRILVWSDDAAIVLLEPATGMDGAGLFANLCSGCHATVDGISHRLGPDLFGVVGRQPGAAPGFDEYSSAMKAQAGVWNAERLDRFLEHPQAGVPGTTMAFPGVPDAEHRRAIIDYLQQREPE